MIMSTFLAPLESIEEIKDAQKNIFTFLRRMRLTRYEIKVYLSLLKHGPQNCRSLCNLTGIPSGKIYLVAENLAKKGWVKISSNERPKKLYVIDPEVTFRNTFTEMKEDLNVLEMNSETIRLQLNTLNKGFHH